MLLRTTLSIAALCAATTVQAAPCGGSFDAFKTAMAQEAVAAGHDPATVQRFFSGIRQDPKVLRADKAQGVFQLDFVSFAQRLISKNRLDRGQAMLKKYASTFDRIRQTYGISPGVLTAFWAFETDYGEVQGDFNTANALATLSHDCRRPDLFQVQLLDAIILYERGDFDPATTTGAWAGEVGMVQMLPKDILANGVDGDGDGHVSLKTSAPDALMSGAKMLSGLGWRPNEPWLDEVTIPANLDLTQTGLNNTKTVSEWQALGVAPRSGSLGAANLPASVLLPVGRKGPAFLAYPNFSVYLEWNKSMTYVMTAAYFADRLEGAPVMASGNFEPGLSGDQMKQLQSKLEARGHDVGGVDGVLGEKTREAVQTEQERLGLPADAWPTTVLLNKL